MPVGPAATRSINSPTVRVSQMCSVFLHDGVEWRKKGDSVSDVTTGTDGYLCEGWAVRVLRARWSRCNPVHNSPTVRVSQMCSVFLHDGVEWRKKGDSVSKSRFLTLYLNLQ